jgi:hypothetical protein
VADWFAEGELVAALDSHGSLLAADGAKAATVGAGLLGGESLGVVFQEGGEGALGQAGGGGRGELLHGGEVEVVAWGGVAEGASGNDFAPLGGEFADLAELLRGEGSLCHG